MTKSKKILIVVLSVIILSCCIFFIIWKVPTIGVVYESIDDGWAVTDYKGPFHYVVIDDIREECEVISIEDGAFFDNCEKVKRITIPDTVTSIGEYAFSGCRNLKRFKVAKDNPVYKSIDGSVYSKDGKTLIFCPKGKTSFTFPEGVTSVRDGAFTGCRKLKSITIPESVISIENDEFYDCSNLENIYVDENNTTYQSIDGNLYSKDGKSFLRCAPGKTSITISNSVTYIYRGAFRSCSSLTSITFEENSQLTSIRGYSFAGCSGLTSIDIPDTVTSIDDYAFNDCTGLTSITIPDTVISIDQNAFYGCTSLKNIDVDENNTTYQSIDGNIYSKDGKTFIYCAPGKTSVIIPDTVTSIGEKAFYNRSSNLISVTFGENSQLTSIGEDAFYNCDGLTSITIPDTVTSIGEGAFGDCDGLTSITIPDTVTSIGYGAFGGCNKLESITLPFIGNTKTGTSNTHFGYIFGAESTVFHPSISASLKSVTVTNTTSIDRYAFEGCSSLTSIDIPDTVTSIGKGAFYGCKKLESITLPYIPGGYLGYIFGAEKARDNSVYVPSSLKSVTVINVTSIDYGTFYDCDGLTSITFPDTVISIGQKAFYGCTGLTSIDIPDTVTSIGYGAFASCSNLENIYIDENSTAYQSIDGNVYSKDGKTLIQYATGKKATSFAIPNSVTSIGGDAFSGCSSLTSIDIPNTVTSIGSGAFDSCSNLTTVTFGENSQLTSIGGAAFMDCRLLQSIDIPNKVTFIGNQAFFNCKKLARIVFQGTVAQWNAISKGSDWRYNVPPVSVVCSDGYAI